MDLDEFKKLIVSDEDMERLREKFKGRDPLEIYFDSFSNHG